MCLTCGLTQIMQLAKNTGLSIQIWPFSYKLASCKVFCVSNFLLIRYLTKGSYAKICMKIATGIVVGTNAGSQQVNRH